MGHTILKRWSSSFVCEKRHDTRPGRVVFGLDEPTQDEFIAACFDETAVEVLVLFRQEKTVHQNLCKAFREAFEPMPEWGAELIAAWEGYLACIGRGIDEVKASLRDFRSDPNRHTKDFESVLPYVDELAETERHLMKLLATFLGRYVDLGGRA